MTFEELSIPSQGWVRDCLPPSSHRRIMAVSYGSARQAAAELHTAEGQKPDLCKIGPVETVYVKRLSTILARNAYGFTSNSPK